MTPEHILTVLFNKDIEEGAAEMIIDYCTGTVKIRPTTF